VKTLVDQIHDALTASHVDLDGRKLDTEQPTTLAIGVRYAGPAAHTPDTEVLIGSIDEVVRIEPPADDGRHDPPSIRSPPKWMTSGERW
jgi:hypothetical protein